jgi:two-component system sensor histidine kinase NblS
LVEELPELLSIEVHSALDALLFSSSDGEDLRCSVGEPARTLRIVMQAVRDASGESLKGIAVTIQDLTREVELNAAQSRFHQQRLARVANAAVQHQELRRNPA